MNDPFALLEAIESGIHESCGHDMPLDMKKALMARIFDAYHEQGQVPQTKVGIWAKQVAPRYLQEMSAMAAGAVEGGSGSGFRREGPFADDPETLNEVVVHLLNKIKKQ